MKIFAATSLVILCVLQASCQIDTADNAWWYGVHYSELINRYGEPNEIIKEGSGGMILSWSIIPIDQELIQRNSSTEADRSSQGSSRIFWANTNGIVYRKGL